MEIKTFDLDSFEITFSKTWILISLLLSSLAIFFQTISLPTLTGIVYFVQFLTICTITGILQSLILKSYFSKTYKWFLAWLAIPLLLASLIVFQIIFYKILFTFMNATIFHYFQPISNNQYILNFATFSLNLANFLIQGFGWGFPHWLLLRKTFTNALLWLKGNFLAFSSLGILSILLQMLSKNYAALVDFSNINSTYKNISIFLGTLLFLTIQGKMLITLITGNQLIKNTAYEQPI